MKYWRLSKEYIEISNELAACAPLWNLWDNKDKNSQFPAFNPKEKIQKFRSDPMLSVSQVRESIER